MRRRALQKTLEKKVTKWKNVLKLGDWTVIIRYGTTEQVGKDNIAFLDECSPSEKVAKIFISKTYFNCEGYDLVWNLDTLILHELIHIITHDKVHALPKSFCNHPKVVELEEHVCDAFARIVRDMYRRKSKKV